MYLIHTCSVCGSTVHAPDARSASHYLWTTDLTCCPGDTGTYPVSGILLSDPTN